MQNKIKTFFMSLCVMFGVVAVCHADDTVFENTVDIIEEVNADNSIAANEEFSADAIEDYNVEGSLFQQITDLEQEKVLMQLEKEQTLLRIMVPNIGRSDRCSLTNPKKSVEELTTPTTLHFQELRNAIIPAIKEHLNRIQLIYLELNITTSLDIN